MMVVVQKYVDMYILYIYCGVGIEECVDIYYTVYDGFDVDTVYV